MDTAQLDDLLIRRKAIIDELSYLGFILKLKELPVFRQYLDGVKRRRNRIPEQVLGLNALESDKVLTTAVAQIQAKKQVYDHEIEMIEEAPERCKFLREQKQQIDQRIRVLTKPQVRSNIVPPREK